MPDRKQMKKTLDESEKAVKQHLETAQKLQQAAQEASKLKASAQQLKKELGSESDD